MLNGQNKNCMQHSFVWEVQCVDWIYLALQNFCELPTKPIFLIKQIMFQNVLVRMLNALKFQLELELEL